MSYATNFAVAAFAGMVGCAPAMVERNETYVNGQQVPESGGQVNESVMGGDGCVDRPEPSWVANPGDRYIVAQSECSVFRMCEVAREILRMDAISRLLQEKCATKTSTTTDGNGGNTKRTISATTMGIHGDYLGSCPLPGGGKGYKMYLMMVAPGVICKE